MQSGAGLSTSFVIAWASGEPNMSNRRVQPPAEAAGIESKRPAKVRPGPRGLAQLERCHAGDCGVVGGGSAMVPKEVGVVC